MLYLAYSMSLATETIPILIVEDDWDDREIMTIIIKKISPRYQVNCLENADDAILHLSASSKSDLPKLIIIDFYLPIVNGLELLQSVKATKRLMHIPLIVYTNSFYPVYKGECMLAGASLYLQKSNSFEECEKDMKRMLSYCLPD